MKKLIILTVILGFISSSSEFFRSCPHTDAPGPDHIESPMCDDVRCYGTRGGTLLADVWATPRGAHTELLIRVTAFVFGVGVPIPVDPPFDNGCNQIFKNGVEARCPTVPGDQYMLQIEMPIPTNIPAFQNSWVRVEFFDRGTLAACGEVLASII